MTQWAIKYSGGDNISQKKVTLSDKIGPRDLLERGSTELSILFSLGQDLLCLPFYIHVFKYIHIYSVCMCVDTLLTLRFLSVEPLTTVVPSNWEHQTPPVWPVSVRRCYMCKERKDSTCEANSTLCILVINNKHGTCICPNMFPLHRLSPTFPVMEFHTRSVLSSDPLTIRLPENCRHVTYITWEDETLTVVDQIVTAIRNQVVSTHDVTVLLFYHAFIPHGHRVLWVSSVCVGESYPGVSSCTLSGALSGTSTRDTQQIHMHKYIYFLYGLPGMTQLNEETPNST